MKIVLIILLLFANPAFSQEIKPVNKDTVTLVKQPIELPKRCKDIESENRALWMIMFPLLMIETIALTHIFLTHH